MAEITTYKSVAISEIMTRLEVYKHNPSAMQRVIYNYYDEITNGDVDIVDPTSPFVLLLESSAINTALAINENIINLRKQYPSLALTDNDLYHHLSDNDFLDRFASPSSVTFTVVMLLSDVMTKMARSENENCYKATFPRDTRFVVDDHAFTLQYPIDIRRYDNGSVKISFDALKLSKLDSLSNNIIDYKVRTDVNGVKWIFFDVSLKQFSIESTQFPLQKSIIFNQSLPVEDQFYYIRAFYRNNLSNNQWVEMITTHSDQVFDPYKPTTLIQVFDGYVKVSIPPVYLTSNMISGEVRYDVYSTKGKVTLNLANYKLDSFGIEPVAIDEETDINSFTNALNTISYYTFSKEFITGGSDGVNFTTLRDRVIFNTTGSIKIPITNKSIESFVSTKGFDIVKNIDTVTNRVFLATQRLPKPSNPKLTTSANIGIATFITDIEELQSVESVRTNGKRLTILSDNLYENKNGVIRILTPGDIVTIKSLSKTALVSKVNSKSYLYSPFYYVLDDTNEEFEVRAYNLDYPLASGLSFMSQNETLQLPVNTGKYSLEKTASGYKFTIVTKSGTFYKQLTDGQVFAQIAYYPMNEKHLAYINGTLIGKDENEERIYEFNIETNYDINSENGLCIINAKMFSNESLNTWLDLSTEFHILYATSSLVEDFLPDAADSLLGKFMLPANVAVSTHETLNLKVGTSLKYLWSRSRSMASGEAYELRTADSPMFYAEDVYDVDPISGKKISFDADGKIKYNIVHKVGDPVLDNDGNQLYNYRKGDVVIGFDGNPVISTVASINKELDILFVDGRHYFADDPAFVSYNDEFVNVLDTWINNDIAEIAEVLLEQTKIYFFPKTTLGKVLAYTADDGQDYLNSEQSIVVNLYVRADIYNDVSIRAQIENSTVKILDSFITESVINMSEIEDNLKASYGNSVQSCNITGLGGTKNYRLVNLAEEENRLALKKILFQQQDTTLIIKEDVIVNFFKVL